MLEWGREEMEQLIHDLEVLGCAAVTITGGGEPLLYRWINELIALCVWKAIFVGLVTNGTKMQLIPPNVSWVRISADTNRMFDSYDLDKRRKGPDYAFSFVAHRALNRFRQAVYPLGELKKFVEYANSQEDFTHVRVVSDIYNPTDSIIADARVLLKGIDHKVIYQSRVNPTKGVEKCLISLLKPVIGADMKVYPCCGVQYAVKESKRDYNPTLSMGDAKDLIRISRDQRWFDGSICDVCYYSSYNEHLNMLTKKLNHREWI